MLSPRHEVSDGEKLHVITTSKPSTGSSRFKHHFGAQIDTRRADIILIICFFISGLTDAAAYNAWNIFLSMQTGNTVFASLGFSNLPEGTTRTQLLKSLCAILCFILGALFFSSLHRIFTPQKRWVLILSFSIQVTLIVTSALLVQSGSVDDDSPKRPVHAPLNYATRGIKDSPWDLLPIGLLSFQAAGQVVASRALEYAQLPTIVISTLYNDLVSDPSFFSGGLLGNAPRNRRVGGIVFYIMGAVSGGVFAASRYGSAGSLWVVALVKGGIVFGWIGWREKSEEKGG